MKIEYKKHLFLMGHTIKSAIRKYNNQTSDEKMLEELKKYYLEKNGNNNPIVGQSVWIPYFVDDNG